MAVVKGQAIRRREGQAPNTLVMAQAQNPGGLDRSEPCPVRGCAGSYDDLHLALAHPRHPAGASARRRMLGGSDNPTAYQRERYG